MLMEKRGTASRHIMDRGTIVMEMTLHNVFVKPDEQRLSLLRLSRGAKEEDEVKTKAKPNHYAQ